ncbi:hypothetical protein JCM1841_001445 [Sporobolomyces salmonicolor]
MASSISVAVRVRPFSEKERALLNVNHDAGPTLFNSDPSSSTPSCTTPQPSRLGGAGLHRKILKVLDDRILVFDPPDSNAVASFQKSNLPMQGKKVKDIRFCFDRVFDEGCGQEEVYEGSAKELVGHVMDGFHSTVFAYGATGCGKTHTISGSPTQPGIVFLIMKDLFARISAKSEDTEFSLTVSYLEVYNETIRDLLAPERGVLQLRDSQDGMATPANLSTKEPTCAQDVVEWITLGNGNRTVNFTEANATSSRSHAVLRVTVTQKPKAGGLTDSQMSASLSVIDLAGSERASVTKNRGERLNEGANINRSLLALGNCINALCDPRKRGHVPYRDSKLTRLLKQSLGGNCKTVMIVCVSPSSAHYDETHNTLQYANRAKEIKTKAIRNVISVDRHVAQYCQQIMQQSQEIERLKAQLATQQASSALQDRVEDERVVQQAVSKVHSAWDKGRVQRAAAMGAAAKRAVLDKIISALLQWQSTALGTFEAGSPSGTSVAAAASTVALLKQECQELVADLTSKTATLRSMEAQGDSAMNTYVQTLNSAQAMLRSQRASALPLFTYETKVLDTRLACAVAEAREEGVRDGFSLQAQAMRRMLEASVKVGIALESARQNDSDAARALARLAKGVDQANDEAFTAFAGESTRSSSASSFASSSSSGLPSFGGTKRDSGARSPLVAENVWDKVARQSVVGIGSAPSGPLASPMRARRSPRKSVSFQAARRAAASPRKGKAVQWRDETGDGWELEDVKYDSPGPSSDFPSVTITSPVPTTTMWTSSSSHAASSDSTLAAEMMAMKARTSSATAALRNKPGAARHAPLLSVSESPIPFSFLDSVSSSEMPPPAMPSSSLSPFVDLANTAPSSIGSSFSMAPGSSGLFTPIVSSQPPGTSLSAPTDPSAPLSPGRRAARRTSNIGPLRSTKTTRRTSYIAPPTPAGANASIANASFSAAGPLMRKAGRVAGASGSSTSPSENTAPATSSTRKSPRKLLSHLIGGGAGAGGGASRRLSTLPTPNLAAGVMQPAAQIPFGQKSAARIAARRASSLAGNTSGWALGTAGGAGAGAGTARKESPSTTGGGAGAGHAVWR